jgi:acylglycerol lipase
MRPLNNAPIRGVICLCHGYMDNISFLKRIEYQRFVQKGFAVVMIEYEGHGRSDGPITLISNWDTMIHDVEQYFDEITSTKFAGTKKFLMGESMGGAIVYDVMNRNRSSYEGVIFVCPMVKVLNTPPAWVVKIFYSIVGAPGSVNFLSMMPWAPSKGSIPDLSFKDKKKMALATSAPTSYGRKPRLATARELLVRHYCYLHCLRQKLVAYQFEQSSFLTRINKFCEQNTTKRISSTVHEFDAPFIILHGLEDKITCPKISEEFYKESPSKDKNIQLYKG